MVRQLSLAIAGSIVFASLVFAQVMAPPRRAAEMYALDTDHTSVVFGVGHNNLSLVYGMFKKAQGGYILDRLNPNNSRFRFSVDVKSIDTNHPERDAHLLRRDFFDAANFPKMTFDSVSCAATNTREGIVYNVTGDLTIRGVTRRVMLPMRMLAEGDGVGQTKDRRTGFLCQFELKRSDYGMTEVPLVGDAVGITISFEGILQPEDPTAMPAAARRQ
jgi:polyisoprenoid-binding protein YceI